MKSNKAPIFLWDSNLEFIQKHYYTYNILVKSQKIRDY